MGKGVSIHAPREGCDGDARDLLLEDFGFNSRTPGGVRLKHHRIVLFFFIVSIHAPREGCDDTRDFCQASSICFNSRTPGGVRLGVPAHLG